MTRIFDASFGFLVLVAVGALLLWWPLQVLGLAAAVVAVVVLRMVLAVGADGRQRRKVARARERAELAGQLAAMRAADWPASLQQAWAAPAVEPVRPAGGRR